MHWLQACDFPRSNLCDEVESIIMSARFCTWHGKKPTRRESRPYSYIMRLAIAGCHDHMVVDEWDRQTSQIVDLHNSVSVALPSRSMAVRTSIGLSHSICTLTGPAVKLKEVLDVVKATEFNSATSVTTLEDVPMPSNQYGTLSTTTILSQPSIYGAGSQSITIRDGPYSH